MNRDDIIRMAREAGMPMAWISVSGVLNWSDLERFAALVAAAEREACADICDQHASIEGIAQRCVVAIRARGQA
jgi:hypothetical protein